MCSLGVLLNSIVYFIFANKLDLLHYHQNRKGNDKTEVTDLWHVLQRTFRALSIGT